MAANRPGDGQSTAPGPDSFVDYDDDDDHDECARAYARSLLRRRSSVRRRVSPVVASVNMRTESKSLLRPSPPRLASSPSAIVTRSEGEGLVSSAGVISVAVVRGTFCR